MHFGQTQRFKMDLMQAQIPGPGTYKNEAGWNKRTFNLKYIDLKNQNQQQSPERNISIGSIE